MKILHISPVYPTHSTSGVHQSTLGHILAETSIGLEVGLLSSIPCPPGVERDKIPGVTLLKSPAKKHYNPWFVSKEWISYIQEEFGTPNVVHFHTINSPFQCALARRCKQNNWPYIITPHGEASHLAQNTKKIKKSIANYLAFHSYIKNASAIRALSIRESEQVKDQFEVQQVIIVSNGVDEKLFSLCDELKPADLSGFSTQEDITLGFIGRIDLHIKGLDLLFEALAKLKELPKAPNMKLFLIGNFHTDKDRTRISSVLNSLNLQETVKVFGPKFGDEKWSYFLACDIFVHTSRTEGIPMAVLEAMALKRPCLVTPETNMGDIVQHAGGWVTSTDPNAISKTLIDISRSRHLLHNIGQQSQEIVMAKLSWTRIAELLRIEYTKISGTRI